MVEGVTMNVDSLSGFGRVNDPLTKQMLRQAIHEGSFLTPFQASGVYDLPNQWGAWYEYGALFSAWLIQQHGMEKYAELWRAMGSLAAPSFIVYRSGYYRIFQKVYRIPFIEAWNDFADSLALDKLEENPDELLPQEFRFLTERRPTISALAAQGNKVYVLDGNEKIRVYDDLSGELRSLNTQFSRSTNLAVSKDGKRLLVSGFQVTGERHKAVVKEQFADTGRGTGRAIDGLYQASYFRDGVIGIRSELHSTCIVYEDFNGTSEVLFRGNSQLVFSAPQAVDADRIAFIAAKNGEREMLLHHYTSGELSRLAISGDAPGNVWRNMRGLGVSEGKLLFSHNADDRMYKLAVIDLATMQATLSGRDFSGGVFRPVSANGSIYYRGAFFKGDGFLRFPESADALSGTKAQVQLASADGEAYGLVARRNESGIVATLAPSDMPYTGPSTTHFGLRYLNPFQAWFPLLLIRTNEASDNIFDMSLDGGGLLSLISEPTGRNTVQIQAYADAAYRMAMIEHFSWQTTVPGFPLTFGFSDQVLGTAKDERYRDTRASVAGSFMQMPGRWGYGFSAGAGYARIADNDGGESAYEWAETGSGFFYTAGFTIANRVRRTHELFGTGLSLDLRGISFVEHFEPRAEALFQASAETRFPVGLVVYGAYDTRTMNLHGVSRSYGQPLFAKAASQEYSTQSLNLKWLAGAEASIGLFSWEIQKNLSHLYFNRLVGTLSARNALYDSHGQVAAEGIAINDLRLAQSLVFRLELVSTIIPLKLSPFVLRPYAWGAWKFSNTITGKGSPAHFGIGVNLPF
jgi:hypothetical protein